MEKILLCLLSMLIFCGNAHSADKLEGLIGPTTIIKAVLGQELISDYTGPFKAYVTHDVYDIQNELILIPVGSVIKGDVKRISNVNEPISARVGYLISSITRPDGTIIDMSGDAALDNAGVAGIEDEVNRHIMAQFLGVVAYAMIGNEASGTETGGLDGSYDYDDQVRQDSAKQFQPLASKYLNLVPTISIHSGKTFNIFVQKPKKITAVGSIYDSFID